MKRQLTGVLRHSILLAATSGQGQPSSGVFIGASVDPGDPPTGQSHVVAVLTWQS